MRRLEPLEGPGESVARARAQADFGEAGPQPARLDLGPHAERAQVTPQPVAVLQPERVNRWAVVLPSSQSPREWAGTLRNQLARAGLAPPGPGRAKWALKASVTHWWEWRQPT